MEWNFIPNKTKQDPYEDIISLLNPCSVEDFIKMNENEKDAILNQIIAEIRKINIFPIFYFNEEGIKNEIHKAIERKVGFTNNSIIIYYHEGLLLLDYLFPNLHIAKSGKTNMIERFYDDKMLKECISDYYVTRQIHNMRTTFFSTARYKWTTPINYNPMRAKAIYEKFCPENGVIYDFCAGFGGRMLGALSSEKNFTYIGTDPNTETYTNLLKLGNYIEEVTGRKNSYFIYNKCAEEFMLPEKSIDFVFSCPPFFKLEKYTDEETQSYNRYEYYQEWLDYFVRPCIKNSIKAMKDNAIYCVDIENFQYKGNLYYLPADWIEIAEEEGLELQRTYPIISKSRKRDNWNNNIYVFTKKNSILKDYTDLNTQKFWQKQVEENKKRLKKKYYKIIEYDAWGNLLNTYKHFSDIQNFTKKEIQKSSSKNKRIRDRHFKIIEINDEVLNKIPVKTICKIDNLYFDGYAEVGKYLNISRQAVHQARKRHSTKLCGHNVIWLENL